MNLVGRNCVIFFYCLWFFNYGKIWFLILKCIGFIILVVWWIFVYYIYFNLIVKDVVIMI